MSGSGNPIGITPKLRLVSKGDGEATFSGFSKEDLEYLRPDVTYDTTITTAPGGGHSGGGEDVEHKE